MSHNGGRLQVNLQFASPYHDFWPLNAIDGGYFGFIPWLSGGVYADSEQYLDANGYPSQMPISPADRWHKPQVYIYGEVNDTWDLKYPSAHTVTLNANEAGLTLSKTTIGAGHDRYTITARPSSSSYMSYICSVQITAMSGSSWTGGIKLFRTENQSLIDAGELFDPLFLERLGYPDNPVGVIRFMNSWNTNLNWCRSFDHLMPATACGMLGSKISGIYYAGTASKSLNNYTTGTRFPGNPAAWTDGQVVQFNMTSVPTTKTITAVTRGATTTMTCTSHGLSNGDRIANALDGGAPSDWAAVFNVKGATTGLPPDYAVTVVDPNTFTISLDSSSLTAISASFKMFPIITVSDGTLPAKRCYRVGWLNHYESEWTTQYIPTGVYHSDFDAILLGGDNGANELQSGIPLSYMIHLCNKLNAHPWICIPTLMSNSGMQSIIQALEDGLNSGLVPRLEYSNEVWNFPNPQNFAKSYAAKFYGPSGSQATGYGARFLAMVSAAETVYGVGSSAFKAVFEMQNVSETSGEYDPWLEASEISGGTPALYPVNKADIIATAPYFNPAFTYSGSAASYTGYVNAVLAWVANDKTTAFKWMAAEMRAPTAEPGNADNEPISEHLSTYLPGWVTASQLYAGRLGNGLELENYEGGHHVVGADSIDGGFPSGGATVQNVRDFWIEFLESEEFADVLLYYFHEVQKLGIKPSQYCITGQWDNGGNWGAQRLDVYPYTVTPAWQACMKFNNPRIALVEAL
jgi:hypothetical protein